MWSWFQKLYGQDAIGEVNKITADLDKIKSHGFIILNQMSKDGTPPADRLSTLRYINQVLDSELAARRYIQGQKRINHGFITAILGFLGGSVVLALVKILA